MIELRDVAVRAGSFSLNGISFCVPEASYAVLMGRTGQGKSTLIETICGLRHLISGHVFLHGIDVTRQRTAERGIGYVPQDLVLFPTLTVREHLEFALRVRRTSKAIVASRVEEMAKLLSIERLLARRVRGLSGGEAQRVALGRALSFHPQVLLLDEPLSSLDETTRNQMYDLLRKVRQKTGVTVLHVTHSTTEARELADCLFIIQNGSIQSVPLDQLDRDAELVRETTP